MICADEKDGLPGGSRRWRRSARFGHRTAFIWLRRAAARSPIGTSTGRMREIRSLKKPSTLLCSWWRNRAPVITSFCGADPEKMGGLDEPRAVRDRRIGALVQLIGAIEEADDNVGVERYRHSPRKPSTCLRRPPPVSRHPNGDRAARRSWSARCDPPHRPQPAACPPAQARAVQRKPQPGRHLVLPSRLTSDCASWPRRPSLRLHYIGKE